MSDLNRNGGGTKLGVLSVFSTRNASRHTQYIYIQSFYTGTVLFKVKTEYKDQIQNPKKYADKI